MSPPAEAPPLASTVGSWVVRATQRLVEAGSPSARLDAEVLASTGLGHDRAWLMAHPEIVLDDAMRGIVDGWLERRRAGEPVAYLRGFKEWRGLRIRTDARALIPRPETELLADLACTELAHRLAADDRRMTVWEVGIGGGALAVALALRFRAALQLGRVRLIASDVASDALALAAENLAAHAVSGLATLLAADLLEPAGGWLPEPDLVVANLPYVPRAVVLAGGGSLSWEPRVALDGGVDGLEVITRLVAQLPSRLAPGGSALLEIGNGQAAAVRRLARALPGSWAVSSARDLAGHERVARLERVA